MEADWSVEIGSNLPVIAVPWEGFVDLRHNLAATEHIVEVADIPPLAEALTLLNAPASFVFTSKCDFWTITAEEIDPFEFDSASEEAQQGVACYIDILASDPRLYASFSMHEAWVRHASLALRQDRQPQSRADFVVRPSMHTDKASTITREGFAITLYVSACGADEAAAKRIFRTALRTATAVTIKAAATTGE
jgi:hypothetical protein